MQIEIKINDLPALLDLYNKEIDTLKSKLLNGIAWEELTTTRKNITDLAIAIHTSCTYQPSDQIASKEKNSAENTMEATYSGYSSK